MGSRYVYGSNPFRDFLLDSIYLGVDISTKQAKRDIDGAFKYILGNLLINPNEVVYLDFEIINDKNYFKIKGKNSISALWLSGFFPTDATLIIKSNAFIIGNKKYLYNKETKELTYTIIYD
ncbi:MAG: hypothetical protein WC428_00425 [Candidatus Paceibacterota bacterium]|jgi:hypothetical protein